jgi:predicted PurR-regulated permease PerM
MAELLSAIRRHRIGLFVTAVGVLLAWTLWSARGALPAFFIGIALALVLDPIVTWLERRGAPRWAGVLLSYAAIVGLVWALIAFAVPPIARQTREFLQDLPQLATALTDIQHGLQDWYRTLPLPPELREMIDESITSAEGAFLDALRGVLGPTIGTLLRTVAFVFGLIIVPVWLFFVLKDRGRFPGAVASALPEAWRPDAANVQAILARVGGRWVRGQLLLGLSIFLASIIGLTFLSLVGFSEFGEFTLILALIAGVLEWFPIIGPIVAAIPAILIGFSISPAAALAAAILYTAIQQLENNLLVPKVMGDAVELHPAVMILALIVGAALFGIPGAILAAPTVAIGRDLYRYTFQRLHDRSPDEAIQTVHGMGPMPPSDDEVPPNDAGGSAEPATA